jgi:hypothetical protein
MPNVGAYLYGFTAHTFQPRPDLRGLAGAPVRAVAFRDVAAIVSRHPVQTLAPSRANVEPHHRVVRHVSGETTLVPAAFGHIGDTEAAIVDVVRSNYDAIRNEITRLAGTCEMGLTLSWRVDNIFEFLVNGHRDLRDARDRVFRRHQPSFNDKLQVGGLFEATLMRERERLTERLLGAFESIACETVCRPPRQEKRICEAALLIDRARTEEFATVIGAAARLFDGNFALEYTGPWPPYSFVRLRLQPPARTSAA